MLILPKFWTAEDGLILIQFRYQENRLDQGKTILRLLLKTVNYGGTN